MSTIIDKKFHFPNRSGRTVFAKAWIPDSKQGTECKNVVVLIHGLGEHLGRYENWSKLFCANGAAVYALDAHGHGRTTGKRGHTENFELIYDDIASLVTRARAEYPKAKIHLYGHSMGGALVLGATLNRPMDIASIIVTGPAIKPGFEPPAWKVSLAKGLDHVFPGLVLGNELDVTGISKDPEVVAAYKKDPLVHDRISVRWFNEWLRCTDSIIVRAKQFTKPILIVHGAEDRLTSPKASEDLAQKIGDKATYRLWPGAFHELHNEPIKEDVFKFIWQWLTSV